MSRILRRSLGVCLCVLSTSWTERADATSPITDPDYPGFEHLDLEWETVWKRGWRGKGVVIAFLTPDSEYASIACNDPRIAPALWVNPAEDPATGGVPGVDDDGNGCLDDVHGCHFGHANGTTIGDGRVCYGDNDEENADPRVPHGHDTWVAALAVAPVDGQPGVGIAPEARIMLLVSDLLPLFFRDRLLPYVEWAGVRVMMTPYAFDFPGATCELESTFWLDPSRGPLMQLPTSPAWAFNYPDWWPQCEPGTLAHVAVGADGLIPYGPATHLPVPKLHFAVPSATQSASMGILGGAMALLLQEDPTLLRGDLIHRLQASAVPIGPLPYVDGWNSTYGSGRIHLLRALLLGDFDRDGVPGDGDASDVAGDAPCALEGTVGCDDNCPLRRNPDQLDTGGVWSLQPDGRGDACQCGDMTRGGSVDATDVFMLRTTLAGFSHSLLPYLPLCPSAEGERCDVRAVVRLRRTLAGLDAELGCPAVRP